MSTSQESIDNFLSDLWSELTPASEQKEAAEVRARPAGVPREEASPPRSPKAEKPAVQAKTPQSVHTAVSSQSTVRPSSPRRVPAGFVPRTPETLREAGVGGEEVSRIILKLLAARGSVTGRQTSTHLRLPFRLVEAVLNEIRKEHHISLKGEAIAGDYTYVITEKGLKRAAELSRECTYFGSAPVTLDQYVNAITRQSVAGVPVRSGDLKEAFSDLLLDTALFEKLGPAINSGRGLFLFGEPGNGKTSIAERVSRSFGTTMWIPRALGIDGQIVRVFDPSIHQIAPSTEGEELDPTEVDQRWLRIYRPTVIAGGELTMSELEVSQDQATKICEAPLQLKSNGGVLLIDDFGRQRMPVDELLNRWIVPLEKRYDLLNLPNGKKVQVPFDQLVIFSTNLEPRELVDDAFLRRIPYKIEVPNPSPQMFHQLFKIMCQQIGVEYRADAINYLIHEHYMKADRSPKACHPRDLLLQIRNFCTFHEKPMALTKDSIDFAVSCYFSVLS